MRNYHVKFRVHYVGGTTDEFDDVIGEDKYHWYSDGSQGSCRLAALAAQHDYKNADIDPKRTHENKNLYNNSIAADSFCCQGTGGVV